MRWLWSGMNLNEHNHCQSVALRSGSAGDFARVMGLTGQHPRRRACRAGCIERHCCTGPQQGHRQCNGLPLHHGVKMSGPVHARSRESVVGTGCLRDLSQTRMRMLSSWRVCAARPALPAPNSPSRGQEAWLGSQSCLIRSQLHCRCRQGGAAAQTRKCE